MSQENENVDVDFDDMTIQQARKYASIYRISLPKDASKEDIIKMIKAKRQARDMALIVDDNSTGPKPGWARITIHRDPMPGATNNPVYIGANGYNVTVPRGVECDVPIKVVGVLNDSVEERLVQNPNAGPNGADAWEYKKVMCYPFQVIAMNPGPDPRPGFERGKEAAMRPRMKFRELFGRWPSHAELLEAKKEGFLKLDMDDLISPAAENDVKLANA